MLKKQYHHGDLKNALIRAGSEILSEEGMASLSLRKVASRAGVSHSAPYAHFADKQALVAAISTEGFKILYARFCQAANQEKPADMLLEVAYAYIQFAQDAPAYFKVMFSNALEQEKEYSEFVDISKKNFDLLVDIVRRCQAAGVLPAGAEDELAVGVWSLVHGFTALLLDRQIPSQILQRRPVKELLCEALNLVTCEKIPYPAT